MEKAAGWQILKVFSSVVSALAVLARPFHFCHGNHFASPVDCQGHHVENGRKCDVKLIINDA